MDAYAMSGSLSHRRNCLRAWRERAEHYAYKLKLLITPLVSNAIHRRDLFIKINRFIDAVQDFIMVHAGNISRARCSLADASFSSPLKQTLLLRHVSLLSTLPDALVSCLALQNFLQALFRE